MQKYTGQVTDTLGNALSGATVTVNVSGGGAATIYSDNNGASQANPITAATDGTFEFFAQSGLYDLVYAKTGYTFTAAASSGILLSDPYTTCTPTAIAAQANDYNPTDATQTNRTALMSGVLRVSSTGAQTITGIAAGNPQQYLTVVNVGTATITLAHQNTGSAAANRIIAPGALGLALTNTGDAATLVYDNTTSRWRVIATTVSTATGASVPEAFTGLGLSRDGATPTTTIDVAAGACTSDDATIGNRVVMTLASGMNGTTGGTWVQGTNNAKLDAGAVGASTWYHVFVIYSPSLSATDILFSTSATAPTLPTNWTKQRRIGSFKTDGASNILAFTQDGDYFRWAASVLDYNATPGVVTAVTVTLASVPTGVNVGWIGNAAASDSVSTSISLLSDLAANDEAPSATAAPLFNLLGVIANYTPMQFQGLRTNTSGQVRLRTGQTTTTVRLATLGWLDRRGRG